MLENEKDILNHTWHVRKRISGLAGPDQTFTKVFLLQNGEVKEVCMTRARHGDSGLKQLGRLVWRA